MVNVVTPFSSQKWDVSSKEESKIRRSLTFRAKASLFVAFVLALVIVPVCVVCFAIPDETSGDETFWPSRQSESVMGVYGEAAVSTCAAPCAEVGKNILSSGGTAVDGAIAVLVCMGANNPQSGGLGGGFLMLFYNKTEQKTYYIDARETAPRNAHKDMFQGNASQAAEGPLSIAIPGELAGYWSAYQHFGKLPWEDLFTPTIKMCREGIEVNKHFAKAVAKKKEKMRHYWDMAKIFLKDGWDAYELGERIVREDLAETLEAISKDKMKALYGPSDHAFWFLEDLKNVGSLIDETDLQSYAPRMREPVQVSLRGDHVLYGTTVPGSGALLAFMMSVLDGYPDMNNEASDSRESAALAYHRIIETLKFGYAHRSHLEDEDSTEIEELIAKLTSRSYADKVRELIDDTKTHDDLTYYGQPMTFSDDHGTAHMCIVAPNGDAVAVTSTINQYFGSMILSRSTGIVLNDEMDDFSSPNITNKFGLPPATTNHVKPGRRPMSSMTPMIMVDGSGNVNLVLGGTGGTTITTGVLQVAARNFFFQEDIKQSIDAPRIHHQLTPNILHYEQDFPETLIEDLRGFGHKPELWNMGMMSIIMGIHRGDDGQLYANSDFRKGGSVDGY